LIEKNILTIDILGAMENSVGCPLCYLWARHERRLMENLLTDEMVMDPGVRQKVVLAKGFCNYHAHLLYKTAHTPDVLDGLGYALYMKDIVESTIERLRVLPLENLSRLENKTEMNILSWRKKRRDMFLRLYKAVRYAVQRERPCPACESVRSFDEIHLDTLLKMLDDEDFRKNLASSKALCLPHFLSAVGIARSSKLRDPGNVVGTLFDLEKTRLQTAADYLSEFIRKQDWNARSEPRGPEVNANSMSLNLLVGAQGLCKGRRCDEYQI
jgi:hypothetical protein